MKTFFKISSLLENWKSFPFSFSFSLLPFVLPCFVAQPELLSFNARTQPSSSWRPRLARSPSPHQRVLAQAAGPASGPAPQPRSAQQRRPALAPADRRGPQASATAATARWGPQVSHRTTASPPSSSRARLRLGATLPPLCFARRMRPKGDCPI